MSKALAPQTRIVHYVCAILLIVLLVFQFTPFWHYGESGEVSTSIGGYIWFPTEHTDLTSYLQENVSEDFSVNDVLICPILMLVLSAIGAVLCVIKPGEILAGLFPTGCGIAAVLGFLTEPVLRLGGTWVIQLLLGIVMLVLGAYSLWAIGKQAATA